MKEHKIGLYINTRLTEDLGTPNPSVRPTYPSKNWPESNAKAKILELAIDSVTAVGFKKIIINVEGDAAHHESATLIREKTKEKFPEAEIISEKKRPSTLEEWRASAQLAEDFFGIDTPVICWFNHDHIFVDYLADLFVTEVERLFGNNPHVYFTYSHQPEVVSKIILSNTANDVDCGENNTNTQIDTYRKIDRFFYHKVNTKVIDGIFVATARGLKYLWNNLETEITYIPRPDWWGLTHEKSVFHMIGHAREFFRHFDGYGNITGLPSMLAMTFSDFDKQGRYIPRRQIGELLTPSHIAPENIHKLGDHYARMFSETCLLALRDARIRKIGGNTNSKTFNEELNSLVTFFMDVYVNVDCAHFKCNSDTTNQIKQCVQHKIFSQQANLSGLVWADVSTYLF